MKPFQDLAQLDHISADLRDRERFIGDDGGGTCAFRGTGRGGPGPSCELYQIAQGVSGNEFFDDDEPAVLFAGGGDHGDPRDGMTPDLPIDIGRVDAEDLLDEEPAAFLMTDQIDLMGLVDRGDHVVTGER